MSLMWPKNKGRPIHQLEDETLGELIDHTRVEGRSGKKLFLMLGELVNKHPDQALSIIRNWMYRER